MSTFTTVIDFNFKDSSVFLFFALFVIFYLSFIIANYCTFAFELLFHLPSFSNLIISTSAYVFFLIITKVSFLKFLPFKLLLITLTFHATLFITSFLVFWLMPLDFAYTKIAISIFLLSALIVGSSTLQACFSFYKFQLSTVKISFSLIIVPS